MLARVWEKLEAYVTPRNNQILAHYQLRCLKEGNKTFKEFIKQARRLIDDSSCPAAARDVMLRDTAVFGIKSNKVRRDAMAICNNLTYQQVYDFAKTEESTEAQMVAIASHEATTDVHAVKSRVQKASCKDVSEATRRFETVVQPAGEVTQTVLQMRR